MKHGAICIEQRALFSQIENILIVAEKTATNNVFSRKENKRLKAKACVETTIN